MVTVVRGTALVAGFCLAACGPSPEPALEPLRLNDIQVLGSHNSYKERIAPALFEILLEERDAERIRTLEYGHPPLGEQLDRGLRKLELDVFYDPEGGRYSSPQGLAPGVEESAAALAAFDPDGALEEPGFKVLHVQDIDFRSNCLTLRVCLEQLVLWSERHSGHLPVTITMNEALLNGSTTFSLGRGMILSSTSKNEQVMTMRWPGAGMQQRIRTESSTVLELVGPVSENQRDF